MSLTAHATAIDGAALHFMHVAHTQVSGIKTFGGPDRLVYFREASAGLNKLAYFWALDTWGHAGRSEREGGREG